MRTLCKDPLVYKDWKTSKWISLLMLLFLFYFITVDIFDTLKWKKNLMYTNKEFVFGEMWFNEHLLGCNNSEVFIYSLIFVALLVIVLFKGEKQNSTFDLLHSMPFKRKDIILSKIKVGFVAIIIPFLVNFVIMTIFYFKNKAYIGSAYLDIPKFYCIHLVGCLFFFAFLVFVQTIVGQYFVATIIAPIILMVPYVLLGYICDLIRMKNNLFYNNPRVLALNKFALKLRVAHITDTKGLEKKEILPTGEAVTTIYKYVYENFQVRIMIMIFLIVIFTSLSVLIYSKIKLEKISELIIFKPLEGIFKLGIGICTGIMVSIMFGMNKNNITRTYVTLFLGIAMGYFISKFMIKFCSK